VPRSWKLERVRGATHIFEEPGSRVCRRIGHGIGFSGVWRTLARARARPRGAFSRRYAFELWSRQKRQSSFRFAPDDEI
jgi:hypothetical protein